MQIEVYFFLQLPAAKLCEFELHITKNIPSIIKKNTSSNQKNKINKLTRIKNINIYKSH